MTYNKESVPKDKIPKDSNERRPVGAYEPIPINIKVITSIIEYIKSVAKTVVKGATERQVIFGEAYTVIKAFPTKIKRSIRTFSRKVMKFKGKLSQLSQARGVKGKEKGSTSPNKRSRGGRV